MAYLDDHPPRHQQFRCPRRRRPSGIIGVHTAESFPDEVGPDAGAENTADFIRRRSGYGSYHLLADSDSIIQLVEFRCVSYHIATHGLNEHTIGISAATQAAKWRSLGDDWVDATVRNMARAAARAAEWLHEHYGITVPARRISLAQALRGERGFLAHGDADPDRRTDPGASFPWSDFLAYYDATMNGDDDMPSPSEWSDEDRRAVRDIVEGALQWPQIVTAPNGEEAWNVSHALGWLMRRDQDGRDRLAKVLANQKAIMQAQGVEVDEQALAAEIATVLVPAVIASLPDTGLTEQDVEDASERAVRAVLGSLDDS